MSPSHCPVHHERVCSQSLTTAAVDDHIHLNHGPAGHGEIDDAINEKIILSWSYPPISQSTNLPILTYMLIIYLQKRAATVICLLVFWVFCTFLSPPPERRGQTTVWLKSSIIAVSSSPAVFQPSITSWGASSSSISSSISSQLLRQHH